MTIKTTPPRCGQKGFTLIEIVMVLVLLGILAAVAVPKYFDLEEQADNALFKQFEQEIQSRLNGEFAAAILSGQNCRNWELVKNDHHSGTGHNEAQIVLGLWEEMVVTNPGLSFWVERPTGSTFPLKITYKGKTSPEELKLKLEFPECN